jgi:hypothetical protein
MNTTLKGKNPACDKSMHDVIRRDLIMLSESHDIPHDPVRLVVGLLWIVEPVDP